MRTAVVCFCFHTWFGVLTAPLHAQGVASSFTDGFLERIRQEAGSLPSGGGEFKVKNRADLGPW